MVQARQREFSTDVADVVVTARASSCEEQAALGFASDTDWNLRDLAHAQ